MLQKLELSLSAAWSPLKGIELKDDMTSLYRSWRLQQKSRLVYLGSPMPSSPGEASRDSGLYPCWPPGPGDSPPCASMEQLFPDFLPTCLVAPFQSPQQAPLPLPILSAGVPQSSVLDPFLHPTRPFFLGDLIGYHGFKDQIWIGNSQVAM